MEDRLLARWERLWLDPEWDAVYGYGDGHKEEKSEKESEHPTLRHAD